MLSDKLMADLDRAAMPVETLYETNPAREVLRGAIANYREKCAAANPVESAVPASKQFVVELDLRKSVAAIKVALQPLATNDEYYQGLLAQTESALKAHISHGDAEQRRMHNAATEPFRRV